MKNTRPMPRRICQITMRDLQGTVDTLNRISCNCNYCATSGKPCATTPIVSPPPINGIAPPNAYFSSGASGGWQLCQQTVDGGVQNVLSMGHRPKRELYNLLWAYIKGIQQFVEYRTDIINRTEIKP